MEGLFLVISIKYMKTFIIIILIYFPNNLIIKNCLEIKKYRINHLINDTTLLSSTFVIDSNTKVISEYKDHDEVLSYKVIDIDENNTKYIYLDDNDTIIKKTQINENIKIYSKLIDTNYLKHEYKFEKIEQIDILNDKGRIKSNIKIGYNIRKNYNVTNFEYLYFPNDSIKNKKEYSDDSLLINDESYSYNVEGRLIKTIVNYNFYFDKHTQGFIEPYDYINYIYENNKLKYEVYIVDENEKRDYKKIKDFMVPNSFDLVEYVYDSDDEIIETIYYETIEKKYNDTLLNEKNTFKKLFTYYTVKTKKNLIDK